MILYCTADNQVQINSVDKCPVSVPLSHATDIISPIHHHCYTVWNGALSVFFARVQEAAMGTAVTASDTRCHSTVIQHSHLSA